MSNKTINVEAICPFFLCESKKSITCEGIITESMVSRFDTEEEKQFHEKTYCTKYDFESCEICKALGKKYDKAEDNRGGMTVKYTFKMP